MSGSDLAVRTASGFANPHDQFDYDFRLAKVMAESGMFKDVEGAAAALAKILLGRDLGLSPTQAMTGIHMVEGKPEIAAVTLASFVQELPEFRYEVVRLEDEACEIHFYEITDAEVRGRLHARWRHAEDCPVADDPENNHARMEGVCDCNPSEQMVGERFCGASRFDEEDVKRAELGRPTRSGNATNHTKYPRNMKWARAMSNGVKWFAPKAIRGIPVYAEGEIERVEAIVDGGAGPVEGGAVGLHGVVQENVPLRLRDRFWAAYGDAAMVRKGMVTAAAVKMTIRGRSEAEVEAFVERMEAENAAARAAGEPADAEVVDPVEVDGQPVVPAEPAAAESAPADAEPAPAARPAPAQGRKGRGRKAEQPPEPAVDADALRSRLAVLLDIQGDPAGLSEDRIAEVDAEVAHIEAALDSLDTTPAEPGTLL